MESLRIHICKIILSEEKGSVLLKVECAVTVTICFLKLHMGQLSNLPRPNADAIHPHLVLGDEAVPILVGRIEVVSQFLSVRP